MSRPITLKKVSLITIAKRQNPEDEKAIGFMRFDIASMHTQEDIDLLNGLINKYPVKEYFYTFHSLADNCYYSENNDGLLEKICKNKKEIVGKCYYEINANNENGLSVIVKVFKEKCGN